MAFELIILISIFSVVMITFETLLVSKFQWFLKFLDEMFWVPEEWSEFFLLNLLVGVITSVVSFLLIVIIGILTDVGVIILIIAGIGAVALLIKYILYKIYMRGEKQ